MRDTIIGNAISKLFGLGPVANFDPLHQAIVIIAGVLFGVLTIGLLILVGKYFFRWGYEEIQISRGRDSFGRRKRRPSLKPLCEERRKGRQQRRLGPRNRRRE